MNMSAARARGGQLVVENVALLAGGATAFETRYKVAINDDSFRKPGNTKVAIPLLHFLLCSISPDEAPNAFKPCFPVLDREQERDFRKLVDARLSALERAKLLPPGVARKSIVSSSGGDKFEQLVWTLSTLALKQAALRHPAHGGAAHNPDPKPPTASDTASNRRYAALLRARIASERAAFARTTQMGRDSTVKWTSEIAALKERIAQIANRTAEVKVELKKLGFDETVLPAKTESTSIITSDGKHHALKTSPIESDDSGSVDGGESDLNRFLAFTGDSGLAKEADDIVTDFEKSGQTSLGFDISASFPPKDEPKSCANVADLVQAAVEELEKATSKMNDIASTREPPKPRVKVHNDPFEVRKQPVEKAPFEVIFLQPSKLTERAKNALSLHEAILESTRSLARSAAAAARESESEINSLQPSSTMSLIQQAATFSDVKDSTDLTRTLLAISHESSNAQNKKSSSVPVWAGQVDDINEDNDNDEGSTKRSIEEYVDETEPMSFELMDVDSVGTTTATTTQLNTETNTDFLTTVNDLQNASAVVHNAQTGQPKSVLSKVRKNEVRRTPDGRSRSRDGELPFHQVPVEKMPKRRKGSKSVRFAELPPSYSASRVTKSGTSSPVMENHPNKGSDDKIDDDDGEGLVKSSSMSEILVAKKCDVENEDTGSSTSSSPCSSPTKGDADSKSDDVVTLSREEEYLTPMGTVVNVNSTPPPPPTAVVHVPESKGLTSRVKPLQRKPTPRHLATRRATVIRNVISERTDSTVTTNQSTKQKLKKNLATTVGRKTEDVVPKMKVESKEKTEPEQKPENAPVTEQKPKVKAAPVKEQKPELKRQKMETPKTPETPVLTQTPEPSTPEAKEPLKEQKRENSPESPSIYDVEPESAPSLLIKTKFSEVSPLKKMHLDGDRETDSPGRTPTSQIVKVFSNEFIPKREKLRRHSTQGVKADAKKNKTTKKKGTKYSKPAAPFPDRVPVKDVQEEEEEFEGEPRRSISSPEYAPRRASLNYRQASNASGGTRLISFPSLYGKRRERANQARQAEQQQQEQQQQEKREAPRRRASISGEDSPLFSWLTGSDRRSNVGRGETFQASPTEAGGSVFRQSSNNFSGSRRSSVFSRKDRGGGSGRSRNEDGTPKSRVKALRDRIAALGRRGDTS